MPDERAFDLMQTKKKSFWGQIGHGLSGIAKSSAKGLGHAGKAIGSGIIKSERYVIKKVGEYKTERKSLLDMSTSQLKDFAVRTGQPKYFSELRRRQERAERITPKVIKSRSKVMKARSKQPDYLGFLNPFQK
jgi:hypothetical protein